MKKLNIGNELLFVFLLLIAGAFSTCSINFWVASDFEKDVNFSSYKTYKVYNHKDGFPEGANPINKQRIERAIHKQMDELGYKTSDTPDLLVSWYVKVRDKRVLDVYRDFYHRWAYYNVNVYEYKEGTFVIDLIDFNNKEVVWHGKTSERVYEGMPNVDKKIKAAVKAMTEKYAKDVKLRKDLAAR